MSFSSNNTLKGAFPVLDMMFNMQRLGLQAMSAYRPLTSAFLGAAAPAQRAVQVGQSGATYSRSTDVREAHGADEEQVIGVGEEVLNVGTRMVAGKTTRVRRFVTQSPVQQDVTLHTETVVLERRRPIATSGNDVLTEVTVEMSDFNEVPVVSKAVHLIEEVLLRKEITARTETIHDTVRRDTLEIEQPSNLPVVFQAAAKSDEKKRDASPVSDIDIKSRAANSSETGSKASNSAELGSKVDQKRT